MASPSRYGLSATAAPRQKLSVRAALDQSKGQDGGQNEAIPAIEARFPDSFDAGGAWNSSGESLTMVLNSSDSAFDIAVAISEAAWPTRVRFALISAPPGGAAGQDEAIREKAIRIHSKANKKVQFHFELSGKGSAESGIASALCKLHSTLMAEWTEARAVAVRTYRHHGKQAEVAVQLGVSQQAVSQMLLGARFREMVEAEKAMREWLTGPKRTTLWPLRNIGTAPAGI